MSLTSLRASDVKKAATAALASRPLANGGPLATLDRGRATANLLRHPKLQPYLDLISPHLPKLAPYAQRILDHLERDLNPHIPILVEPALLPRLLPFLGPLLEELPYFSAHLHLVLPHRQWLLPCLDKLVPHLTALRPHAAAVARRLPQLEPHLVKLIPVLPSLLPQLDTLLAKLDVLEPYLSTLCSDDVLPLITPHIGVFAAHIDQLAPHLPSLIKELESGRLPRAALPPLIAALPQLLPNHLTQLLAQAERIGPDRLPELVGRPYDLIEELRVHAPPSYYAEDGSVATNRADDDEQDGGQQGGTWRTTPCQPPPAEEEEVNWLQGVLNFFGGATVVGGGVGENTGGDAAAEQRPPPPQRPKADLAKVNAAITSASRALEALEGEFVRAKHSHAARMTEQQNAAVQCAKLEATLADVDDGLVALSRKTRLLERRVEAAEDEFEPEQLMYAGQARQVSTFHGRTDGLFSAPAWEQAKGDRAGPPGALPAFAQPPPRWLEDTVPGIHADQQPRSPMARSAIVEDDWLSKIAL